MADRNNPTLLEYENIIEELMKENDTLKNRISELELENKRLKKPQVLRKDILTPKVPKEPKKSITLFKMPKKVEVSTSLKEETKYSKEIALEITNELYSPTPTISSSQKPIIEGKSRRDCPVCGNTRHIYIHEEVDKTNLILDYPRVYGKKYKCGKCGGQWRVSPTLE
jgi:predicted RNA-binding Zn-ribbon protein involved in translation (DUF1610 family)